MLLLLLLLLLRFVSVGGLYWVLSIAYPTCLGLDGFVLLVVVCSLLYESRSVSESSRDTHKRIPHYK